jgi:hypothetical protein
MIDKVPVRDIHTNRFIVSGDIATLKNPEEDYGGMIEMEKEYTVEHTARSGFYALVALKEYPGRYFWIGGLRFNPTGRRE